MLAKLRFFYTNAQSLLQKFDELKVCIADLQQDVISIRETWRETDVMEAEIVPGEYQVFHRGRIHIRGGGITVFVKKGIISSERKI